MAKDRISSNRPSFSETRSVDPRGGVNFAAASAGGLAGSSPDSGSKPGAEFEGAASGVGRAGSSISAALGVGDCEGESSALAPANADSRTNEMIACHFMRLDQNSRRILQDLSADRKTRIGDIKRIRAGKTSTPAIGSGNVRKLARNRV
jgi:hypothetical protein